MLSIQQNDTVSPARPLEMLSDRFGAFEAIRLVHHQARPSRLGG
jgi:hypothetical protein